LSPTSRTSSVRDCTRSCRKSPSLGRLAQANPSRILTRSVVMRYSHESSLLIPFGTGVMSSDIRGVHLSFAGGSGPDIFRLFDSRLSVSNVPKTDTYSRPVFDMQCVGK